MSISAMQGIRHAAIPVFDIKRALDFYLNVLGFDPYLIADSDWAMVQMKGTTLSLVPYEEESSQPKPKNHPAHLGITVPSKKDVDHIHDFLSQKKLVHLYSQKRHRDGSYGFYLKDTEENWLEIIYIPEKPEGYPSK